MSRRTTTRLAVVMVFALTVAACGGGSGGTTTTVADDGGEDLTTTTAPEGGSGGEGVALGVLVPLTGELGAFGEIVAGGVELAANEVNGSGGLVCAPLELVVADFGGDPEAGIREATRMIESNGAVAILGPTSETMVALADLAISEQVVLMSPYAGTISLNELGGDFVYRTVSSDLGDGEAAGRWLVDQGYQRVAFMVQNEESTLSPAAVAREQVQAASIELVADITYNPGQPSYQAELSTVLTGDPDVIFLAGGQESGVTVMKEAEALGYEGEWLLTADLAVQETIDAVGPEIMNDRAYVELANPDTSLPAYQNFAALWMEATGGEPGPFAANSWDMVNLVALAMQAAGECTGPAINANLRDVADGGTPVSTFAEGAAALANGEDIDYEGASGPVAFDESGTVTGSYSILQVQNGAWVEVEFYTADSFQG